ncbi:response regulator transcription factor [Elusimicrobiota bacterium]
MQKIWVVDDDPLVREALDLVLSRYGHYSVTTCPSARAARALLRVSPLPHLMVLDQKMPGMNGLRFAVLLRQDPNTQALPILMLTADRTTRGLEAQALRVAVDDFVRKPAEPEVVLARIQALLRRCRPSGITHQRVLKKGPFKLDFEKDTVHVGKKLVRLAPREFTILHLLLKREPGVVPRRVLAEMLSDKAKIMRLANVDKAVERLRKKVGPSASKHIITQRKVGYGFEKNPRS